MPCDYFILRVLLKSFKENSILLSSWLFFIMDRNIEYALDCWTRDLSNSMKSEIRTYHCDVLAHLRLVRLDMPFLHAAIRFWDPNTHTFRFNNNEITPLPEEIGAIIEWPKDGLPCMPDFSEFYYQFFENFLGLEKHEVADIVHGHEVNLLKLVSRFRGMGRISPAFRRRAFIYCLFCHYLFPYTSENLGIAPVISIVEQCEVGRSPTMLCAGELMLSLDDLKKDPSFPLTCCPIILQV